MIIILLVSFIVILGTLKGLTLIGTVAMPLTEHTGDIGSTLAGPRCSKQC